MYKLLFKSPIIFDVVFNESIYLILRNNPFLEEETMMFFDFGIIQK